MKQYAMDSGSSSNPNPGTQIDPQRLKLQQFLLRKAAEQRQKKLH